MNTLNSITMSKNKYEQEFYQEVMQDDNIKYDNECVQDEYFEHLWD